MFVSASASGMNETLRNNLQVFFLSALGVLTLTFIAIYAMTYRLVRPLRQMVTAVRSFAGGDFSARVPVSGKDEVAELATSLNNMAVSLSSTEGMHRSFVANVSHELKTPMTTIAGFIDGILDGTIPQEKRELLSENRFRRGQASFPAGEVHAGSFPDRQRRLEAQSRAVRSHGGDLRGAGIL